MSKIAFLFPGQGAQYVGMGKDFYEAFPVCREVFEEASKASGLDIPALCFEENDKLNQTEYTQICMLAVEAAILKAVETQGIQSDVNAGLSLGEYGAVIASGVMSLEDAFRVVRQRGIYMQEAVPTGGAMTAVLGLDAKIIEKVCEEVEGIVSVANYNCPGQIVITGEEKAVDAAAEKLKEAGAKRAVMLPVSAPFHSRLMEPAALRLKEELDKIQVNDAKIPVVANVTGKILTNASDIKESLVTQAANPVLWEDCVAEMVNFGVTRFVEVGPGKVLTGFTKKINKEMELANVEDIPSLEKTLEFLKGVR